MRIRLCKEHRYGDRLLQKKKRKRKKKKKTKKKRKKESNLG